MNATNMALVSEGVNDLLKAGALPIFPMLIQDARTGRIYFIQLIESHYL